MTLIIGLKSNDCVVVGAEQEESGGIAAKHSITKLRLITGSDWVVVVGGAGDSAIAEHAMRDLEKQLRQERFINEQVLMAAADSVLDAIHTKYVDKDPHSEGVSLVIGASCGDGLHLISTAKRVPQTQDSMAYAGIGADIGIYFMDRLHRTDGDWMYMATVAGLTLQQAMESCRYCSGESEIFVLQSHPNPRWRALGNGDAPANFTGDFQGAVMAEYLEQLVRKHRFSPHGCMGYRDEHHPEAKTSQQCHEELMESVSRNIKKPSEESESEK